MTLSNKAGKREVEKKIHWAKNHLITQATPYTVSRPIMRLLLSAFDTLSSFWIVWIPGDPYYQALTDFLSNIFHSAHF